MKNLTIKFHILLFTTISFSCVSKEQTESSKFVENQLTTAQQDDLVQRLSTGLTLHPTSIAEKDRNAIYSLAIDSLWDIQETASGLCYQILQQGAGDSIQWADYLEAHYEGRFLDGFIFDSSFKRRKPLQFYVGNMIEGWNEGLQLLRVGGKIRLITPSHLAYQEAGLLATNGDTLIPPHQILVFYIEVLKKTN
ncbi:MAG: hypothetical protein HC892_01180 [Saprospiraceae bacterium]|nr:hypothetical protein [Saprospiraceae bacterium]